MKTLDQLRNDKNAAELELSRMRIELSTAQSRFAQARKRHQKAQNAYIAEAEKQYGPLV